MQMWCRFSSSTVRKNDAVDASFWADFRGRYFTPPGQRWNKGAPTGKATRRLALVKIEEHKDQG